MLLRSHAGRGVLWSHFPGEGTEAPRAEPAAGASVGRGWQEQVTCDRVFGAFCEPMPGTEGPREKGTVRRRG